METTEQLLLHYKGLINFEDKDQKNNFKWIDSFLKYQKRKHPEEDNRGFMLETINLHVKCFMTPRLGRR